MLGKEKEKEKNLYTMLIAVGALFTFITVGFVYVIVSTQVASLNVKVERLEKFLDLQYAQIGGEENFETALEISRLTKEDNKRQMEEYLKNIKAQKEVQANSALAPLPSEKSVEVNSESNGSNTKVIELTEEDLKGTIEIK